MKELTGKTVTGIAVNQDQDLLKFKIEDGSDMLYHAYGDCCSESWFADITVLGTWRRDLFPVTVEAVQSLEIPDWVAKNMANDGRTRQESDEVYGYEIVGSGYSINIVYRNSSNGYYGGECELLDTTKKWAEEVLEEATWTEITGDWRA